MELQDLLNNPPLLHQMNTGELTSSWKLHNETLYYIDKHVNHTSKTLETGGGMSTILFTLKGAEHTCIVPDQGLVDRIKQYCVNHQIDAKKLSFQVDKSENVLPSIEVNDLDLVLIDGRHAFPSPFIDWYYTAWRLKVGGLLLVDNTEIWTGAVLRDFLLAEQEWQLQQEDLPQCAAFKKLAEYTHSKTWGEQVYTLRNSRNHILSAKIQQAFRLLRQGQLSTLMNKLGNFTIKAT
ncbi:class I SAM-dependent methyltransferase [Iningainema tapete]|uniref:Class I SAM-dependent methyltransferase n=1 Tax=Iningainema tapete BLCC-T55 TaxID=2748662 RepID=A0A8J6XMK9_9CYAN|nr:class I SAM-dependent methyltransferase [Iningainema tapete]MBD2775661.1 class I SAM-dependent methyltransferase [Iningainema tapete BLCC-T55]